VFCGSGERPIVETLAEEIRTGLEVDGHDTARRRRALQDDEERRQQALDELGIVGAAPDPRLDDLVELARTAFGTESAEINFIDRDRQWKMAVAGGERRANPRAHAFCAMTIRQAEPTVIADAARDPRVMSSPLVRGPHPIRFYAAHPIESPDGYRIGSFCVYDSEPRELEEVNLEVLRDLALLAQAEITGVDGAPLGTALTA
jgi:GAF domain-containing protein